MEAISGLDEQDRVRAIEELNAPGRQRDPDHVPQEVIDEEMSMFMNFARQTGGGGV